MDQLRVSLNFYNCTHVYFRDSSCSKCIDICPVKEAIFFEDGRLKINEEKCINCGACFGICPTEAFSINGFSPERLMDRIINSDNPVISCRSNVPCIAVLDPQYLVSLTIKTGKNIIIDLSYCENCSISSLKVRIEEIIRETNYFLEISGSVRKILKNTENINTGRSQNKDRREFLKDFGKISAGLAFWTLVPELNKKEKEEEDFKNIVEEKILPQKRKILIKTYRSLNKSFENIVINTGNVSFCSDKWIDSKLCTNCSICYNICPTGALKPGKDRLQIIFEPSLCVKCKVCHESCPENCLHLKEELNFETFLNGMKVLAEHVMIPCEECLTPFSFKGESTVCPRCKQLDDEIKDLLKI